MGSHWYDLDRGIAIYETETKDGNPTPVTIRHAKAWSKSGIARLGVGSSTIAGMCTASEGGLLKWGIDHALRLTASALRIDPELTDSDLASIVEAGMDEVRGDQRGEWIHAEAGKWLDGGQPALEAAPQPAPEAAPWVYALQSALESLPGDWQRVRWESEQVYVNPTCGYGCRADIMGTGPDTLYCLDIKTKSVEDMDRAINGHRDKRGKLIKKRLAWDSHAAQLAANFAAWRATVGETKASHVVYGNIFLARELNDAGDVLWKVHNWTPAEIARGWDLFTAAFELFCLQRDYDPRKISEGE